MPPSCDNRECREELTKRIDNRVKWDEFNSLKSCVRTKTPKKVLWAGGWAVFLFIVLPLLLTGIKVWSGQESDHLRYVDKDELVEYGKTQIKLQTTVEHMADDIRELKEDQKAAQKAAQKQFDEILRRLP